MLATATHTGSRRTASPTGRAAASRVIVVFGPCQRRSHGRLPWSGLVMEPEADEPNTGMAGGGRVP
jgi:hypothetical protein